MNQDTKALVLYRLERSQEALLEADTLFKLGHYNTAINRLYYACFYAVNALLLTKGLSSAKHAGVRSLFNQHWGKPGLVEPELRETFNLLFDKRQKGDYGDLVQFSLQDVEPMLPRAKRFVEEISKMIRDQL